MTDELLQSEESYVKRHCYMCACFLDPVLLLLLFIYSFFY